MAWPQRRAHKYGAKATVVDGVKFSSAAEAKFYKGLKLQQAAGDVVEIELQPKFVLQEGFKKNGKTYLPIKYVADFKVTRKSGKVEIYDVKGMRLPAYIIKQKLFEYRYPDLTIKEV
ncbi:MAG: DUF1064 domain-containing protein [Deltaproteobacteria bacterium]|nr:DUF1064 domain-containing protein [Deltaproteobacteria bacterium]